MVSSRALYLLLVGFLLVVPYERVESRTPIPWHRDDPAQPCLGQNIGCCTPITPCDEGEGDCDTGHDCKVGLQCGYNNCVAPEHDKHWFNGGDDCCEPKDVCMGEDDCCSAEKPCDLYEGDCDWDHDCRGYLKCGRNNCWGRTFEADDDCCEVKKE